MNKEQDGLGKEFAAELRQNAAVQIYLTPPEAALDQTAVNFRHYLSFLCATSVPSVKQTNNFLFFWQDFYTEGVG